METQKALADRLFPIRETSDDDELEVRDIPPEQRRLHTETADLTVSSIHHYLANNKIVIPEFQRGYVWTRTQASRLIESLLIQCPIPVVYFSQSADNTLVVIDGNQRLLSIKLFMNDAFSLQGLTTYPELNGYSWSSLDPRFRDHVNNRTIRCITILKDTHPQIKFDVFERLNTGSVKLNAQELRHGLNHGLLMKELARYQYNRDERALGKALSSESDIWGLMAGGASLPNFFDGKVLHDGASYPSAKNLKRLFYRIGVDSVLDRVGKILKRDAEILVESFQGIRTALAHAQPPPVTIGDVEQLLGDAMLLVGALDRILYSHISKHGGPACWSR